MIVEVVSDRAPGTVTECIECGEPSITSDFLSMYCQAHTDTLAAAEKKEFVAMTDGEMHMLRSWNATLVASLIADSSVAKMAAPLLTNIINLSEEAGRRKERGRK